MSMHSNGQRMLSYVDALREAVSQEMARDERVFVMGLDVDDHKGIQGSTRGLVDRFGPDRVFTTPLSEDAMTGVAIGAAMAGMRPIHVHIRMDFLMLCMNQLINMAAKSHYMYGGQVKVPMVVRSMIGKSWGQGAQHSQGLHAMFMHVPGLKVAAPSNAHDAKGALIAAIRDDNPFPRRFTRSSRAAPASGPKAVTSRLSAFPTWSWRCCARRSCCTRSASRRRSSIRSGCSRSIARRSSAR
jgi:transketolase C-terminal domain/subunit